MNEVMDQVELALPARQDTPADAVGFGIGWDHAHYGLVPPPGLLLEGTPIGQGWRAGRAVFSGRARPWPANRHTRAWLALRITAWLAGATFDLTTVTPNHLAQIDARRCPVRRVALGGGGAAPDAPCIERLNPGAAYAAGNLVVLSRSAAQAWRGLSVADLVFRARHAEAAQAAGNIACPGDDGQAPHEQMWLCHFAHAPAGGGRQGRPGGAHEQMWLCHFAHAPARGGRQGRPGGPLEAAAWWRLAALRSFATPLPEADAARLPLAVLPPNRVRVLNAAQALQVLLTLVLSGSDWCARAGEVAALLPAHGLRTDFNLWLGAIAPRLLAARSEGREVTQALEDAWLGERVQRRWQHLALTLGERACEQLVRRLAGTRLPGKRTEWLHTAQAMEGWASAEAGAPQRPDAAALAPAALPAAAGAPAAALGAAAPAPQASRRRTAPTPLAQPPRATALAQRAAR